MKYFVVLLLLAGLVAAEGPVFDADIAKANSYDDEWQDAWVSNMQSIAGSWDNKTDGFVFHLGDSITHYSGYSQFAENYKGNSPLAKTAQWSYGGEKKQETIQPDSKNGWALSYFNVPCEKGDRWRSYTACKGITSKEVLDGAWVKYGFVAGPTDRTPLDTLLNNTSTEPINDVPVAIVHDAMIAIVMLGTNDIGGNATPASISANLKRIADKLIAKKIIPVISTIPPHQKQQKKAAEVNALIRKMVRENKLPLIDFYAEILRRQPEGSWYNTIVGGDGIHLTYHAYRDPISSPAEFNKNGNLLRGFLSVCKIMEIREHVINAAPKKARPAKPSGLTIITDTLPEAVTGTAYEFQIEASGGTEPLKWSATALPKGLKLDKKGRLYGKPLKTGTSKILIKVSDRKGKVARIRLELKIK